MNKKKVTALMTVTTAVLLGLCVVLFVGEDRTGPEIAFEDKQISYREGGNSSELLEGVAAVDDRDGDVSDTLRVDRITEIQSSDYVVVTYIAKDRSNNITKDDRWVNIKDGSVSSEPMVEYEEIEETNAPETEAQSEETDKTSGMNVVGSEISLTEEESEEESETDLEDILNDGVPVIKLTTNELQLDIGDSFDCMNYIEACMDDEDSISDLYSRIIVNGEDKNGNVVGAGRIDTSSSNVYTLYYYVSDSDGNFSDAQVLTVTVE